MDFSTFASGLQGAGFYVPTPGELHRMSAALGEHGATRRAAADTLASGRSVIYSGHRVDAASLPEKDRRKHAMLRLLSIDHVVAGTSIGTYGKVAGGGRMDSSIPMAGQALISVAKNVYQIEHAGLGAWNGEILPIDTRISDPAAEQYAWFETDIAGVAKVGSTYDPTTVPMVVGAVAAQNVGNIVPALIGYEDNFMEGRRAALARANGKPDFQLDRMRVEAAKRAIAQFFNALWLYGDATRNINGLHTHPAVGAITSSPGVWTGLTTAQLTAEIDKLFNWPGDATQGRLKDKKRIKVLLPPAAYDQINLPTSLPGNLSGLSVWQNYAKSHKLGEDQIVKCYELAAVNSAVYQGGPQGLAADRAYVIYMAGDEWDPRFVLSQQIEIPAAPVMTGMGTKTFMHARGGGMVVADAQRIYQYNGL